VTAIAIADELSAAAELVMEKTKKSPVVIIRNYPYDLMDKSIDDLIRPENEDLFK
jgi:coenzyme F420-0:L-glutamate ligase/coenzyme F420-1:gamma-L-glutamate ligase